MQSFDDALTRLWPSGDQKIPGLRAGMIASAGEVFDRHGIDTPLLVAHVMAQISHECGAGRDVVENLNYTAARMMQVWPSRFRTLESAAPYAHNPPALAAKVYNGRMGNAPGSADGWNFRGRGAVQTTGRDGYARLAKATGLDLVRRPDLVNDPRHFLACGVADFIACGCLPYAKADDITGVTRRLNGGTIGLSQRKAWLATWKAALGQGPVVVVASPPLAPELPEPEPEPAQAPATARPSLVRNFIAALAAAFRRS
ncbi:glycoside hydrolase family 19 protein [Rhodopseudomonas sp. NSM]|uniref:glycoside hydrolase family 19 protein n=1 Tax=Rhodopseudomonas sp. NSM TaxID=3457630 RepID=UPI004035DE30